MSMNLHADEMELWQTPSWVTEVCLFKDDSKTPDNWKSVRFRYARWVQSRLNGVHDTESLKDLEQEVEDHLKTLYSFERLHFWQM